MTILERIDQLRTERGWSVNYLAMEAMLTQSTLNNLYVRNAEPKLSTLRAVCEAFGITLSEFFRGMEEGNRLPETNSELEEISYRVAALPEESRKALLVLLKCMH